MVKILLAAGKEAVSEIDAPSYKQLLSTVGDRLVTGASDISPGNKRRSLHIVVAIVFLSLVLRKKERKYIITFSSLPLLWSAFMRQQWNLI